MHKSSDGDHYLAAIDAIRQYVRRHFDGNQESQNACKNQVSMYLRQFNYLLEEVNSKLKGMKPQDYWATIGKAKFPLLAKLIFIQTNSYLLIEKGQTGRMKGNKPTQDQCPKTGSKTILKNI